jgi:hypothetical protein
VTVASAGSDAVEASARRAVGSGVPAASYQALSIAATGLARVVRMVRSFT